MIVHDNAWIPFELKNTRYICQISLDMTYTAQNN